MATWNSTFKDSPAGTDSPAEGDDKIRELKEAIENRIRNEHTYHYYGSGVTSDGSEAQDWRHREGSAVIYYGASEPTQRPDLSTTLSSTDDDGRLWLDSDDDTLYAYYGDAFNEILGATTYVQMTGAQTVAGVKTFSSAAVFSSGLSAGDSNITNVGDIAVDSVSADGTTIDITLTDNVASALDITESTNSYLKIDTTDGSELVTIAKALTLSSTLTVAGATTLNGDVTVGNASGDALTFHPSAWTLSNAVSITGTWADLGTVTTVDINGGTIDNTAIGGTIPAAGDFTTITASSTTTLTGDLAVDTDTLYVDVSTDRVGVGTSTPATALDVSGDITMSEDGIHNFYVTRGDDSATLLDIDYPAVSTAEVSARFFRSTNTTGSKTVRLYKGDDTATLEIQLGVDGTDSFFNTDTLYVDATNDRVGVNTSSPTYSLDIAGNQRITYAPTNGTAVPFYIDYDPNYTSNGTYYNRAVDAVVRTTGTSGVTNSGDVMGVRASVFTNSDHDLALLYGVYAQYGSYTGHSGTLTDAYGIYVSPYNSAGTITNMYDVYLGSTVTGGTITNHWGIYQYGANDNYLAGSVGVGTSSPDKKVEIEDSSDAQLRLTHTDATDYADFTVDSAGDLSVNLPASTNVLSTNAVLSIGTHDAASLTDVQLTTNGVIGAATSIRLVTESGGSLYIYNDVTDAATGVAGGSINAAFDETGFGIGTGSPASKIHGVETLSAATGNEIAYQLNYTTNKATSGNDTGLLIGMTDTASPGTSYPLDVQVDASSVLTLDEGGNLTVTGTITAAGTSYGGNNIPDSDDTWDLGSGSAEWKDLYIDGVAYIDEFGEGLIPDTNNSYDLGSDALEWKDLYIDGTAYLDSVDIDGGSIDGATIGANSAAAVTATAITLSTGHTILENVGNGNLEINSGTNDDIYLDPGGTLVGIDAQYLYLNRAVTETQSDTDGRIFFASDAYIAWDESSDWFQLPKALDRSVVERVSVSGGTQNACFDAIDAAFDLTASGPGIMCWGECTGLNDGCYIVKLSAAGTTYTVYDATESSSVTFTNGTGTGSYTLNFYTY